MREILLELACRSALLRIAWRSGARPGTTATEGGTRERPWFALSDSVRDDMARLGRQLRDTGQDARTSPFWILLEHQWAYERAFAPVVHADLRELAPEEIYRGLLNGRTLHWEKWEIDPISPRERMTADGLTAMESPIWVKNPAGARRSFSGVNLPTARDIYLYIAFSRPRRVIVPAAGGTPVLTVSTVTRAANSSRPDHAATGT